MWKRRSFLSGLGNILPNYETPFSSSSTLYTTSVFVVRRFDIMTGRNDALRRGSGVEMCATLA